MRERMILTGVIWGLQLIGVGAWESGKWLGRKISIRMLTKRCDEATGRKKKRLKKQITALQNARWHGVSAA